MKGAALQGTPRPPSPSGTLSSWTRLKLASTSKRETLSHRGPWEPGRLMHSRVVPLQWPRGGQHAADAISQELEAKQVLKQRAEICTAVTAHTRVGEKN